ncbi:MAG: sigma 54-interacting transcriptional regulator [Terracidiphilus sp.]
MNPSDRKLVESLFAGDGEMATRMRELDWSATPLGPVEQWPQALRTCVRLMMGAGYPMTILWGPDLAYLYNDANMPVVGTKHPWALGRGCREIYPESWDFVGPLFDRVMTKGEAAVTLSDQLFVIHRKDYLEECYFAFSFSPVPDDSGRAGGVLNIVLETTERVLEDRRRRLLGDLASRAAGARNQEEVWRVSAETFGENCLSLPFAFLYEYRPSEHRAYLTGVSVETAEALRPPVIDCRSVNLWRLNPAMAKDGVLIELGDRASGVPVPNWPNPPKQACVAPIRLGDYGDALGFLVAGIHPGRAFDDAYRQFVYRITEQITIGLASASAFEQERRRADALAEVDRAKTQFFSNVSHEFRTPLTLMLGPLDEVLSQASERLSPEDHEQLMAVRRNSLRLLKLVNTLLDFSRIEAGRVQASYEPTDLATFTTEIASAFDSAMQNAGLRFSVECQPVEEPVYVDRDMWEKIVLNLLSNAYKFTFTGEVALTLKPAGGAVELQVRDTGVGIPEEHREQVFERFHRVESTQARTFEGTGIGLALVQELVKLHGGTVRVESAVGAGSTFTVTIPRGKEHLSAERIHAPQSLAPTTIRGEAYIEELQQWLGNEPGMAVDVATSPKLASPAPSQVAMRELIVVADDNADMRQYLTRLLSERYEVHAVADGRQALEATQQLRPALVLADIMMPQLDGFGLLRAIRNDSAIAGTPVFLLSARAGEESRVEGLEADADDYLIKPFAARELMARVAAHVKMSNLRRETAEREERMRGEAELEREKLRANEERWAETSRLYRELQRSETFLAQGQKISHTGSFGRNVLSEKLYWSEETYEIYELDRSVEPTMGWLIQRIHPEDRARVQQTIETAIHQRTGFDIEYRLMTRGGSVKYLHVVVQAQENASGELEFVGAVTDITAAKQAEEKIRQSEKEARELLDLSPLHITELGPDGARLYTNRASLDYYGITVEDWRNADLQQLLHPQDTEIVTKDLPRRLGSRSPFEYEVRLKRGDGQYRWFHYRLSPMIDQEGHTTRWYAAGTDIDDRKLAEQRLQEENIALREEIDKASMFEEIVGTSAPLKKVLSQISKVAPTESSVLITGETGTGKELVARAIHRRSGRSQYAFVSVNCAAIPRDLIGSELFGHEKGAFTGATQRRLGRFELAEKGTIFLDEIGELPAETQVALLRVLQEHEFERIGGTGTIRTDVRVIAATNRDLESAIAAGTFRSDLFYRLDVFPIEIPPLRKRREDIPLLVSYFVNRYARKTGRHFTVVDKKSMSLLEAYAWPGNIRELQNVIERSVIVNETQTFSVDESWLSRRNSPDEGSVQPRLFNRLPAQEKAAIEAALRECGGRVYGPSGAAAKLGIPRTTLESKITALKINKNRFKPDPSKGS